MLAWLWTTSTVEIKAEAAPAEAAPAAAPAKEAAVQTAQAESQAARPSAGSDDLTSLLVRTNLHRILLVVAFATAVGSMRVDISMQLAVAGLVLEGGFVLLQAPVSSLVRRGLDPTAVRYFTSLACWAASLHIVVCWGLCIGLSTARPSENVLLAATVAIGAGAQNLLANFSAGLLLLLQRPFRVGDWVTVGDETFEVTSIMSFVTHGKSKSAHVTVPNARVLSTPIFNLSSRRERELVLAVHVKPGKHAAASIRKAVAAAAAEYDAGRAAVLEQAGAEKSVCDELPPAASVYGPLELGPRGMRWEIRCTVPANEEARLRCTGLAYERVHDALLDVGIAVYETSEALM